MSNLKNGPVEFKKRPCRRVEFSGLDPLYRIGKTPWLAACLSAKNGRWRDGRLVLVFAATRRQMALRSVRLVGANTENKMSNFSTYKSKSKKVKMNYSRCHRH